MTIEDLHRRRESVESVRNVVSAMRANAAGRIQAAQRAMTSARRYREVITRALRAVGVPPVINHQAEHARVMGIVFTSEQPLCGDFNHAIVAKTRSAWPKPPCLLISVGNRGTRLLNASGYRPQTIESGCTSLPGLRNLVRRLSILVDKAYTSSEVTAVEVIYNHYHSITEQQPKVVRILPFDPGLLPPPDEARQRIQTFRYLPEADVLAGLVGQYAYISLYHAAAESYASEQASRLIAMDGATRNSNRIVDELIRLEREERQHLITRQVLEQAANRLAPLVESDEEEADKI